MLEKRGDSKGKAVCGVGMAVGDNFGEQVLSLTMQEPHSPPPHRFSSEDKQTGNRCIKSRCKKMEKQRKVKRRQSQATGGVEL